ncbi:cytochrome P450 [Schizopora paradoxa]|uniref:Cytochrome P450 n=1 Tax=Schizopora paradoxa TaxID=27342 RepID=A0A0H2RZX6_9AGAM|nr:cytochrome P450 [Schizopora paradoxa]
MFQWQLNHLDIAVLALCGLLLALLRSSYNKRKLRTQISLPPGPRGLPILGNTLDMLWCDEQQAVTQWGKQYGDVVLISLLGGRNVVYLNSPKAINDLLEKRSRIYSDRPRFPLVAETAGTSWNFGLTPYGESWRLQRKIFVNKFGVQKANEHTKFQEDSMKPLLRLLLQSPEQFLDHIELHANRVIMKVVYDIYVKFHEDESVASLRAAMQLFFESTRPISYLVESLPIVKNLKFLWPGSLGRRSVAEMRRVTEQMVNSPFAAAKTRIDQGDYEPSYVSDLLGKLSTGSTLNEEVIRNTAAVAFQAGSDTTAASSTAFVLAMTIYPEVQRKAQAEIDRVIGTDRLPTIQDKGDLPYIFAVYMETLRWHTVLPQGVPHCLQEDDVYGNYFLPSGSIIVPNIWKVLMGILHDSNAYTDPMTFKPERYLSPDGTIDFSVDPRKYAFGFGRSRICAGMHFGENSVWIFIARVLATMSISHKIDELGREIEVRLEPTPGLISRPFPFQCAITPRSNQAKDLIVKD